VGGIIGAVILYFFQKSSTVSREVHNELNNQFIRTQSDLANSTEKIKEISDLLTDEKTSREKQTDFLNQLQNEISRISAENNAQNKKIEEQQEINHNQTVEIKNLQDEKQSLIALKSQLAAQNDGLQKSLDNQKEEIIKIQHLAKEEFQNLANNILEEKSKKFTDTNKENLNLLLKPLGENLQTFKKRVDEVYENPRKIFIKQHH